MAAISKEQIKRIYALGAGAGVLRSGDKDDELHALVYELTGKTSISSLTSSEFSTVEKRLLKCMKFSKQRNFTSPGKMTQAQQKHAWKLLYELISHDKTPHSSTAGERMIGIIKKVTGVDARPKRPFEWLSQKQGSNIIETLKRYISSAEKRCQKNGSA